MSTIHTKWLDPKSVIKKLENWRDKGTVLNLIISAGGGINVDVTINSFEYKKFGGKGDYSYSISFYRYRPLKIQTTKDLGIDKKKKKTTTRTNLKKSSTDKKNRHTPLNLVTACGISQRNFTDQEQIGKRFMMQIRQR